MTDTVYLVKQWDEQEESCCVLAVHRTKEGAYNDMNVFRAEYGYPLKFWIDRYELED